MIRVGLIGFGLAGRVFHAPIVSSVGGLELAAVLERTSDHAAERYPGITTYRTLEPMIDDSTINLFVVATPNAAHFPVAKQLLEAGKSIVVDKPTAITSAEIAELITLATKHQAQVIPFHNRRWDSDFQTLQNLIHEDSVGRIVHFESTFDRWRPVPRAGAWKDDPSQGGMLLDIGTHLADQALILFGKPDFVWADQSRERDGQGASDAFSIHLRYAEFAVHLAANVLSTLPRPRFHLRGTRGNYSKWGLDPQENALKNLTRIDDPHWGEEPAQNWGTLSVDVDDCIVTRPVPPIPGDYRHFYIGVRDAILGKREANLGKSAPPVSALSAWRVARLLESAAQSARERREIVCDWRQEPA